MSDLQSILCPVDFSEGSRGALRYACAIADHFACRLTLMTVDDPLLVEAASAAGQPEAVAAYSREALRQFYAEICPPSADCRHHVDFRVTVARPAAGILRVAGEARADLIVMSSQGRSGFRKLFFGSTTDRVLRETTVPVLVTQGPKAVPGAITDVRRVVRRVLAPVDLGAGSRPQLVVAARLARALSVPLIVAHVIDPVIVPPRLRERFHGVDLERRSRAEDALAALVETAGLPQTETIVVFGEPSEEIAKLVDARDAGLIVIGLQSSMPLGPHMGSVTYRVVCLANALVLALPPDADAKRAALDAERAQQVSA